MKYLLLSLFFLLSCCGCATTKAQQPDQSPVAPPKTLSVPVGKNWKIIEEAPKLTDERDVLPFQTEQSVQPPGAPVVPDKRKLEMPR